MNKLTLYKIDDSATLGFYNNAIIDGINLRHINNKGTYFDAEQAEFIVTACNAHESSQAQITRLQAQLEAAKVALEYYASAHNWELYMHQNCMVADPSKAKQALEAMEGVKHDS